MKLRIYDLGRGKALATFDVDDATDPDEVAYLIFRKVGKMNALGSRGIDVTWDAESKTGQIYVGGVRLVGKVRALTGCELLEENGPAFRAINEGKLGLRGKRRRIR